MSEEPRQALPMLFSDETVRALTETLGKQKLAEMVLGQLELLKQRQTEELAVERQRLEMQMATNAAETQMQKVENGRRFWERIMAQILGFLLGLSTVICGLIAALYDKQITGAFVGTSGIAGLVAAFIAGRPRSNDPPKVAQPKQPNSNNS